ncbi:hypothetical protein MKP08_05850 [Erythrobacter sp. LQ02-29]|nr:hypothetical protein [Erythrobacter sp. LQ02-29]MCP9222268.1 hypothetical protein [Erythrobacter sp. LQ02-29]
MMDTSLIEALTPIAPLIGIIAVVCTGGWVINTWLRIRHGYPLDGAWGQAVYPKSDEAVERVKLLTKENAELRAEIGSMKDRLATVERIVTDRGYQLSREFDALRSDEEKFQ